MISNSFFSVVTTLLLLISSIVGGGTTAFETDKDLEGFFGEYYESRYEGLGDYRIEAETFKDVSEAVAEDNNLRKAGLENYQRISGTTFTDVDCSVDILNTEKTAEGSRVALNECVTITYTKLGMEDSFSFITNHIVELTDDGIITSDIYDECLISGFCNVDFSEYDIDDDGAIVHRASDSIDQNESILSPYTYNRQNAINYANTYATSSNSAYNTMSYDDANYVSQCLYAGGIPFDGVGNYNSGWYYITSTNSYSLAWVNVDTFDTHFVGMGVTRQTASTSTILPGNPFYWKSTGTTNGHGHIMICTGYNSSGDLIYCAHNPNVSGASVSVALAMNSYTKYTLLFNEGCSTHNTSGSYTYNTSKHWKYCTQCGKKISEGNHKLVGNNNAKTCTICGYQTNVPLGEVSDP